MMQLRHLVPAVGLALGVAACSDSSTAPTAPVTPAKPLAAVTPAATNPLANIPILSTAGTLLGTLNITNLSVVNGVLQAAGTFTNAVTGATTAVIGLPIALVGSGPGNSCPILHLHIGAIELSLLGLNVDLAPVDLDITAQRGPGNLLGNLLCAVANLLNGGGPLAGLQNLLNQINAILAGL